MSRSASGYEENVQKLRRQRAGKDAELTREQAADLRPCRLSRPQPESTGLNRSKRAKAHCLSPQVQPRGGRGWMAVTKLLSNSEETGAHFSSLFRGNDGNLD